MHLDIGRTLYINECIPDGFIAERPAERLIQFGPDGLRTCELLALVLGTDVSNCAELLGKVGMSDLVRLPFEELSQQLTPRQSRRFIASIELGRRVWDKGLGARPVISCPADVVPLLVDIRDQQREHFLCLHLNARHQLIHKEVVSIGSLSASIVHPREVFQVAVQRATASLVLAHNHPSGEVSPSRDDLDLTKRLVQAGLLMGIEVLDHIIIGSNGFMSLKEAELM